MYYCSAPNQSDKPEVYVAKVRRRIQGHTEGRTREEDDFKASVLEKDVFEGEIVHHEMVKKVGLFVRVEVQTKEVKVRFSFLLPVKRGGKELILFQHSLYEDRVDEFGQESGRWVELSIKPNDRVCWYHKGYY